MPFSQSQGEVQISIAGAVFTSLLHECSQDHSDNSTYGLLFGSHRMKRTITMTDSTENDLHKEHRITISHYKCSRSERPLRDSASFSSSPDNTELLGTFVIKRDTHLFPSFRDIAQLEEIQSFYKTKFNGSQNHCHSPLLLLMISAPKTDSEVNKKSWIYSVKHSCFTYIRENGVVLSTVRLNIPSLAPDLLSEFSNATCLNSGNVSTVAPTLRNNIIGGNDYYGAGLMSQQVQAMTGAGITQVVETELMTSGLMDSIKAELNTVMVLEDEIALLRKKVQERESST